MQMPNKKIQNSLNRTQKEAICLLSIGTFLEYFDLMLYVHLAVLLNDLFFPQSDPTTKYLRLFRISWGCYANILYPMRSRNNL